MNDNVKKYSAEDRRYTIPQACGRVGLKTTAIYAAIRHRGLVAKKIGRLTFLFESDITEWLANAPVLPSNSQSTRQP